VVKVSKKINVGKVKESSVKKALFEEGLT